MASRPSTWGQYRFHRAELLEWATANQIKVSVGYLTVRWRTRSRFRPRGALEAGDLLSASRHEQRPSMRPGASVAAPADDRELLLRLFLAREAAATTAIGGGIATARA